MNKIIAILKFISVFLVIFTYALIVLPLYPFINKESYSTKKKLNALVSFFSQVLLRLLNIKVSFIGNEKLDASKNYLIVSNHMSYTDILIMSAHRPTSYVTSIEMKEVPFLGQITQLAGCLYVERRSRKNLKNEISQIEKALTNGLDITIFPESTSTNHEQVLKFKRSLFQTAINTHVPVAPLTLNYVKVNNEPITQKTRDYVCWYGDMKFAPHLWDLVKCKSIEATIYIHPQVEIKDHYECSGILRDECYKIINEKFIPVTSNVIQ